MERIRSVLNGQELEALDRAIHVYQGRLEEKLAELNQVQTHLKVNEGLMQEVRQEKERLRREMVLSQSVLEKMKMVGGGGE